MAQTCGQCGGAEFDIGDTSLQKICMSCGVVLVDQSPSIVDHVVVNNVSETISTENSDSGNVNLHTQNEYPNLFSVTNETVKLDHYSDKFLTDTCIHCGGSEFDSGDLRNGYRKVCVQCGIVADDPSTDLTGDEALTNQGVSSTDYHCRGNLPTYYSQHSDTKRISRAANSALKKFNVFSQRLNLPSHAQQYGEGLLKRVLEMEEFKPRRLEAKIFMAAACVYIACRQLNWPTTLNEVANLVENCTKHDLMESYSVLCDHLGIERKHVPFKERVELDLRKFDDIIDAESSRKALKLADIVMDVQIVDGRSPRPLIYAMVYIILQASGKRNLKMQTFLKDHSYDEAASTCQGRYNEICDILCAFTKKIPWLAMYKCTRTNVVKHLDTILTYSKSLKLEMSKNNSKLESKKRGKVSQLCSAESAVLSGVANVIKKRSRDEWVGKYPPSFARQSPNIEDTALIVKRRKLEEEAKDIASRRDLDKPELDENDICDTEVNCYMRSPKEVELYNKMIELQSVN